MRAHSEALRRRWADPVYRERQLEANRRMRAARRAHFADPLARKHHSMSVKMGWRNRKRASG